MKSVGESWQLVKCYFTVKLIVFVIGYNCTHSCFVLIFGFSETDTTMVIVEFVFATVSRDMQNGYCGVFGAVFTGSVWNCLPSRMCGSNVCKEVIYFCSTTIEGNNCCV